MMHVKRKSGLAVLCVLSIGLTNCSSKHEPSKATVVEQTQEKPELNDSFVGEDTFERTSKDGTLEGEEGTAEEMAQVTAPVVIKSSNTLGSALTQVKDGKVLVRVKGQESKSLDISELEFPLKKAVLNLCGETLTIEGDKVFVTGKERQLYRVISALKSGSLIVSEQVPKSTLQRMATLNDLTMVDSPIKLLAISEVSGIPTTLTKEIKVGDKLQNKDNSKHSDMEATQLFCDGTMKVLTSAKLKLGYWETIESQSDFVVKK